MNSILNFVLELYRLAQDAPVTEFPDLALGMLKAHVRFRSATWSEAQATLTETVAIRSVHLHNEPDEVRLKFSSMNQNHTRVVIRAARQPGKASITADTLVAYGRPEEAPMRAYMRRYGHDRNLMITDLHQWMSLYRPRSDEPFSDADAAIVNLLWNHLAEALMINRALAIGMPVGEGRPRRASARALVDERGGLLHCGTQFLDLLRREWRDWSEPKVPFSLFQSLQRGGRVRIAADRIEIVVQPLSGALLLIAREVSPLERLSPRELTVAREFGAGKSYKAIARDLRLAPATVRNLVQKTYRKLEIDNKAALARLLELERR